MSESNKKGWQQAPFMVEVKEGESKAYCMCGLSKNPPFCDGAHQGTKDVPMIVNYEKDETVYVCGCQASKNLPFCDGSHQV